jgi:hypothetical protein
VVSKERKEFVRIYGLPGRLPPHIVLHLLRTRNVTQKGNSAGEQRQPIAEHPNQEVMIGFAYDERGLRRMGISEHFLKPVYFSTTTGEWVFPGSQIADTNRTRAAIQIDHVTDFVLTGAPGAWGFLAVMFRYHASA